MRYFIQVLLVCVLALFLEGCQGCSSTSNQTGASAPQSQPSESAGKGLQWWWDLNPWARVGLCVIGIVCLGTAIMMVISGMQTSPAAQWIPKLGPSFFFWLGMTYLAILLLIAILYNGWERASPVLIGGILPVAVPWFGALGAVTISLDGVFRRNAEWDARYNYWHIGRPLFGATLGIVAFFIFLVLIKASGTLPRFLEPTENQGSPADPSYLPRSTDFIVFYIVAFLVGYREETFSELIKRVTDLILKPGQVTPAPGPQMVIKLGGRPAERLAMENTAAGQTSEKNLEIQNTGDRPLIGLATSVSVTPPAAATTFSAQLVDAGELPKGQSRNVTIKFTPPQAGQFSGTLIVTTTNPSERKTVQLAGTGT